MKCAAIDIGTVTTRLLIAEVTDGRVTELLRRIEITHLGADLGMTGQLDAGGIERVAAACAQFRSLVDEQHVEACRCVATSAARDADNTDELAEKLARPNLQLEVISGEEEAQLSFAGATYGRCGKGLLVVDPGGGSTEFVLGDLPGQVQFSRSLQIGSQRMTDAMLGSDPPTRVELAYCSAVVRDLLTSALSELHGQVREMIAVAGTATTMVTVRDGIDPYDATRVQGACVTRSDLQALMRRFRLIPTSEREAIRGLEPQRASVIVAGTLILQEILDYLGLEQFCVSDTDLLYGILLKLPVQAGV
ncbi:MAG: Ppx/GppA family phosphatase [Coriobacteriia bacterium]|nr:Ppx/GppA family phosphatase [Coriobacteriia bacterium]